MKIYESGENYLETILILTERKGSVRSIDIVNEMGFSKPSVSVAMKQFREGGYIQVDEDGFITLTDTGREIAERMLERHRLLTDYLVSLGVDEETAQIDACKLEHDMSQESFEKLREHYQHYHKGSEPPQA
ncbi:MAG TPA: metal-dependent transcriptional regulator [Clostridia bacterium]|nr:metal-dependent transcriptional regulator [Clostridia bacterium]